MAEIFDPTMMPVALSFIFVFAIVFGLLSSTNMLNFPKPVKAVIAAVFGAFSAAYQPFVTLIQDIMPIASIVLIILFFLVFLKKIGGEKKDAKPTDLIAIGIVLALLLIVLGTMGDRLTPYLPAGVDATGILWLAGIAIILMLFWIAYSRFSEKT